MNAALCCKHVFDAVVALVGLIVLALPLLLLAALVLTVSGSPILFRQRRVGKRGREFTLYKFRTMTPTIGAEAGVFTPGNRMRVTPLGRFLRKTKLDELPQLWNVLRGNMALVGPRPEVRKWVEAYPERWAKVLTIRPGITDPASIVFRNEEELLAQSADPERTYRDEILPKKLDLYEQYVATRSFRGDLSILLKTVWVVVGR